MTVQKVNHRAGAGDIPNAIDKMIDQYCSAKDKDTFLRPLDKKALFDLAEGLKGRIAKEKKQDLSSRYSEALFAVYFTRSIPLTNIQERTFETENLFELRAQWLLSQHDGVIELNGKTFTLPIDTRELKQSLNTGENTLRFKVYKNNGPVLFDHAVRFSVKKGLNFGSRTTIASEGLVKNSLAWQDLTPYVPGTVINHPDGFVQQATLAQDLMLQGMTFKKGTVIVYYSDDEGGGVKEGWLAKDCSVSREFQGGAYDTRYVSVTFKADTPVAFHPSGSVYKGVLAKEYFPQNDQTFDDYGIVPKGYTVAFTTQGALLIDNVHRYSDIPVFIMPVDNPRKGGYRKGEVTFHPKGGEFRSKRRYRQVREVTIRGEVRKKVFWVRKRHEGYDMLARLGDPLRATAGGIVVKVEHHKRAGNYVTIYHGAGVYSKHLHCQEKFPVKPGDIVAQGDMIAFAGNSGLRPNGKKVNGCHDHIGYWSSPITRASLSTSVDTEKVKELLNALAKRSGNYYSYTGKELVIHGRFSNEERAALRALMPGQADKIDEIVMQTRKKALTRTAFYGRELIELCASDKKRLYHGSRLYWDPEVTFNKTAFLIAQKLNTQDKPKVNEFLRFFAVNKAPGPLSEKLALFLGTDK